MKKILIIEDDVALGDILVQKVTTSGYVAKLSRDGKEGFEEMKKMKPDLVLLDIVLPSMNGYEILEAKQNDAIVKKIPVIVISNSGQPVEINRTLALGVRDYIIKAEFDVNEVITKVRQQLNDGEVKGKDAAHASLSGKKILWVEDDQFLHDLVARKLSQEGVSLINCASGEEALEKLGDGAPDIVLLDVLLPGISGYDVLTKIKSDEKTKRIPVILFSNFGQKMDVDKGIELGASRFLLKAAISLDELVETIRQVLSEIK